MSVWGSSVSLDLSSCRLTNLPYFRLSRADGSGYPPISGRSGGLLNQYS